MSRQQNGSPERQDLLTRVLGIVVIIMALVMIGLLLGGILFLVVDYHVLFDVAPILYGIGFWLFTARDTAFPR